MATSKTQDIKTFKNQTGYWEHDGAFSVELTPSADKSIVPPNAEIRVDTVHVRHGRIKQTIGGIQLYSEGSPLSTGATHTSRSFATEAAISCGSTITTDKFHLSTA
jgi:hypothetical protein